MNVELYNEDCLLKMKDIPNNSIDLILCDLPYGSGTTACKWDIMIPIKELWEQYERIIKNTGNIVLFGKEPFSSMIRVSNIPLYRYDIVWQKEKPSNFQLMNYQPGRVHENIMIFSKAKMCYTKNGIRATYNPQTTKRDKPQKRNVKVYGNANLLHPFSNKESIKIYDTVQPISIVKFNIPQHKVHPTQKPLDLLRYLIKQYSNKGDIVLDNCMGSISTGIAAVQCERNFIGIEKDPDNYKIGLQNFMNNTKDLDIILKD